MSVHSCAQTVANLRQSDGTAAGTVMDTSLNTGGANIPTNFVVMGTTLFFTAPGASLWSMPT
jgi:ELWxxDGT repeat protein